LPNIENRFGATQSCAWPRNYFSRDAVLSAKLVAQEELIVVNQLTLSVEVSERPEIGA
jgi:hypothetical protein